MALARQWRQDHVAAERFRPVAKNVIFNRKLEHGLREKPVPTFSRHALAELRA
jgi:hypothetical protein